MAFDRFCGITILQNVAKKRIDQYDYLDAITDMLFEMPNKTKVLHFVKEATDWAILHTVR